MKLPFYFLLIILAGVCLDSASWAQSPADPLQQIEAKRRELQLKQVMERGRLLKELQRTATANADLAGVNALQAQLDLSLRLYQQLQTPEPGLVVAAPKDTDFHKVLQGRVWKGQGNTTDFDLSFEGPEVVFKYTDGKVFKYVTEVLWPGLLRYKHPSGQVSHLVFDDKGGTGYFVMYTTAFPGTQMNAKRD
jgi:hypothetical protein